MNACSEIKEANNITQNDLFVMSKEGIINATLNRIKFQSCQQQNNYLIKLNQLKCDNIVCLLRLLHVFIQKYMFCINYTQLQQSYSTFNSFIFLLLTWVNEKSNENHNI